MGGMMGKEVDLWSKKDGVDDENAAGDDGLAKGLGGWKTER